MLTHGGCVVSCAAHRPYGRITAVLDEYVSLRCNRSWRRAGQSARLPEAFHETMRVIAWYRLAAGGAERTTGGREQLIHLSGNHSKWPTIHRPTPGREPR